jgi:hypothetical protein
LIDLIEWKKSSSVIRASGLRVALVSGFESDTGVMACVMSGGYFSLILLTSFGQTTSSLKEAKAYSIECDAI